MRNSHGDLSKKCRQKGIAYTTVLCRIKRMGMSVEDALNTPVKYKIRKGIYKKCKELGIQYHLIYDRMRLKNLSFEEAVNFKRQSYYMLNGRDVRDICKENGLNYESFKKNVNLFYCSIEEALQKMIQYKERVKKNIEKYNHTYTEIKQLSKQHNIGVTTVYNRLRKGIPLEEALTKPINKQRSHKCK